jgi:hypothetical protein
LLVLTPTSFSLDLGGRSLISFGTAIFGPFMHPLGVDDLMAEEVSVDELEHSRLACSSFLVALWLLALEE